MLTESQVRQKLQMVAARRLTVWKFADWLEGAASEMYSRCDRSTTHLVGSIRALFAQYDHDFLSESDLLSELLSLGNSIAVSLTFGAAINEGDEALSCGSYQPIALGRLEFA